MKSISTKGLEEKRKYFHNEEIPVYPTYLSFDEIDYWPENDRTLFTFERLEKRTGKTLDQLSLEEITNYIAEEPIHKLDKLAKSILQSGVQVPLIVRDDGKLLDGNRRYFACSLLKLQAIKRGQKIPVVLNEIPVYIVKQDDLKSPVSELKIIAEANFVPDLRVTWPHDAQARAIEKYYRKISTDDQARDIESLADVFGIERQRVRELLETLQLTKEFIANGESDAEKIRKRQIVEDRFVYFWEFVNKGIKGKSGFEGSEELSDVKSMFFNLMDMGKDSPLKNVKQIEPLVQSKRDKAVWNLLVDSNGAKLNLVVSYMNDKKEVRKAEDKIRLFSLWLENVTSLMNAAKNSLKKLAELANRKSEE